MKGLLYCSGQWSNSFCATKLTQASIDAVLILTIMVEMGLDIRMRGSIQYGFTQIIQTMMILTLICNLAFSINHDLSWFYYLQSLLYDWYFCTLVFYVTYRILDKNKEKNMRKIKVLKICYLFIMGLFSAIFIYSGLSEIMECKQIWFVSFDITGLAICSIAIRIGHVHHRQQIEKMIDFKSDEQINNPLSKMWALILINLFCQLVQLVESLIFLIQPSGCQFSQSQLANVIIKFLFSFFSLHLSFICTIVIFHMRRDSEKSYSKIDSILQEGISRTATIQSGQGMIEMALIGSISDENNAVI